VCILREGLWRVASLWQGLLVASLWQGLLVASLWQARVQQEGLGQWQGLLASLWQGLLASLWQV
jgi:hypothetical protein